MIKKLNYTVYEYYEILLTLILQSNVGNTPTSIEHVD